ncbi:MAG: molybdenum cofactor guanylyltransferase [Anaerolineae bacterium]|nr:molybdenum cofactor guanylyltransferase [Anaerolineae bacterium]
MRHSGIVLAGGRSRRMGADKRRLRLWGENAPTLLEHTCATIAPLCAELIVVLNDPEAWSGLSARLVYDVLPEAGVLGGLYSGLLAAQHNYCLVVGADMPFLNAMLLQAMLDYPKPYQALVPRHAQGIEPLHAIYRRDLCHVLGALVASGERQLSIFVEQISATFLPPEVVAQHDPLGRAFFNLNTPEDVLRARALLRDQSV